MKEVNLTTLQILETFGKNTTLKARALLSDYFKKEITVAGKVLDVRETFPEVIVVSICPNDKPETRSFEVSADFTAGPTSENFAELSELSKGEQIKLSGVIVSITPQILNLKECNLIEKI